MILLAGAPDEAPLARVREALIQIGAPFVIFDQGWPGHRIILEGRSGRITGVANLPDGTQVRLEDIRATYARLVDHRRFLAYRVASSRERIVADAANVTLCTFLELTDGLVLNRTAAMGTNGSKPYQLSLIKAWFAVPPTLVTNDPERARAFAAYHGRVIYKSASSVRSIVTELDAAAHARLEAIRVCPVQFQAVVEGLDVRVHVVGNDVFATACESDVVDYRYASRQGGTTRLSAFILPEEVRVRCLALAHALGLPLAGIDLKRTREDWVCFEVNPSPGYTWFEQETGQPIAAAIARLLLDAAGDH